MRILSLDIQDILSIQNASLKFEDTGLVLIEGFNYDTGRANGAGKTAIFNALSFALYDKLPRKITASEIVRMGCKTGYAKASVLVGEDVWTAQRTRPKGVIFYKNDIEQLITQAEFESFIRLSYAQFLLTIYTPQANSRELTRFLSSPDSSKKEFLLQLLNLDKFSSMKRYIDELIKQRQVLVDIEDKKIDNNNSKISVYEESLIDVLPLSMQIDTTNAAILDMQKNINELLKISAPDFSKYSNIEDNIKNKQSDIIQAKTKRSLMHDKYRELRTNTHEYDENALCGECGSSLDTESARIAHSEHQSTVKQKIVDLKKHIDDLDLIISKENEISDLSKKLRDKKQQESSDHQDAKLSILDLRASVNHKTLLVENMRSEIKSNNDALNKIQILNTEIDKSTLTLNVHKKDLELYKTLSTIYSPTGAQAYVLDSIVDSFNEIIQKYIDLMSPNITYILNSFKENAKGDIIAKFSETLTRSGKEVSVGSLSGGEEKGLSLCVDFALLEVLETQFGMSLNPIILDEPFDALDTAGREIVIDLLENLARNRQILVIDHSSEIKSMFSSVIRVELRNDISVVKCST